jgi:catechol 2,3-dioxygenase-like lactoylglutathione lyase family enzyme
MPNPRAGVIDHMAFTAKGLAATLARLDAHGIQYVKRKQAGVVGTWQIFFHDPNGARVELDFAAAEGN